MKQYESYVSICLESLSKKFKSIHQDNLLVDNVSILNWYTLYAIVYNFYLINHQIYTQ